MGENEMKPKAGPPQNVRLSEWLGLTAPTVEDCAWKPGSAAGGAGHASPAFQAEVDLSADKPAVQPAINTMFQTATSAFVSCLPEGAP